MKFDPKDNIKLNLNKTYNIFSYYYYLYRIRMRSFRHFQSLFSEIFRNFANQWTVANCKIYSKTEKYMYLCILKYIKPKQNQIKIQARRIYLAWSRNRV